VGDWSLIDGPGDRGAQKWLVQLALTRKVDLAKIMKKRELLRLLRDVARGNGLELRLIRQGANHEVWHIGDRRLIIPRHREINEITARGILGTARGTEGSA
jgi:mRNA interferase HicA